MATLHKGDNDDNSYYYYCYVVSEDKNCASYNWSIRNN